MKRYFFIILVLVPAAIMAQSRITKYYDSSWTEIRKEKAEFSADFVKNGTHYDCISYWINTSTIRGRSVYPDTVMNNPIGLQVLYYKNGQVEDSVLFKENVVKYFFRYYPNNQLEMHYYLPDGKTEGITEGYEESGKKIKNYVFEREAEFKNGARGWEKYITKNVEKNLFASGNEKVQAKVVIQFIIDENGKVILPAVRESSGYKEVDKNALQVVADSPNWRNAIRFNLPVKAYRLQPMTYILTPKKK